MTTQLSQERVKLIYFAFLFSSLIYVIIGIFLSRSGWEPVLNNPPVEEVLLGIFLTGSFCLLFLVNSLRGKHSQQTEKALFQRSILLMALSETPAILGLVAFFLTGNLPWLIAFWVISLLSFLLCRPQSPER